MLNYFLNNLNLYILLINIMFISSLFNIVTSTNMLIWLLSVELIFICTFLTFLLSASYFNSFDGFIYALLTLIVAAGETAIGLALVILYFNNKNNILLFTFSNLKNRALNIDLTYNAKRTV